MEETYMYQSVMLPTRTASAGGYWFVLLLVSSYLVCIAYQVGFFFFLVAFGLAVLITALVSFETAFLFVPLVLMNPYTLQETGTKLHVSEVVLLILFGVWFLRVLPRRQVFLYPKEFLLVAGLFILMAISSLLKASHPMAGLLQIVRYVEVLLVFFLIVVNSTRNELQIRRILLFLILGGLVASLIGIGQFFWFALETGQTRRVFGWHGGNYGAFIASTLIISLSFLFYDKERTYRVWALITIPVAGMALLLSQTRTWIAAFLIALGFVVFRPQRKLIGRLLLFVGVILLMVIVVVQTNGFGLIKGNIFQQAVESAFRFGVEPGKRSLSDLSLFLRLRVWAYAISLFLQNPFVGIGVGGLRFQDFFTLKMGDPGEGIGYVDNQYIQVFTEIGIVGGIAWLVYTYRALRTGKAAMIAHARSSLFAPVQGMFGSLLIFVIGGFFWVITINHETFALMVLQIGLLVKSLKIQADKFAALRHREDD